MHLKRIQGSINEDNGLSLAFTIAHELGHRLIKKSAIIYFNENFLPNRVYILIDILLSNGFLY